MHKSMELYSVKIFRLAGEPCGASENPAFGKGGALSSTLCYQRLPSPVLFPACFIRESGEGRRSASRIQNSGLHFHDVGLYEQTSRTLQHMST